MTHPPDTSTRRNVLTTAAMAGVLTIAGCTDETTEPAASDAFSSVTVDGTELVVEYDPETAATTLTVIAPSGESFAERELTPGASRETVGLGTAYPPGTYTVQLVDSDEAIATAEQGIRPAMEVTELQLARNHPDEMYEGAAEFTITTEVIVTVENVGTGPEKITALRFSGDVPRPTPDDFTESGITAVGQPVTYAEPVIGSDETLTLYSRTFPFSPDGDAVECTPEGTEGQFTVELTGHVAGELAVQDYDITYQGDDLTDCEISVEEAET